MAAMGSAAARINMPCAACRVLRRRCTKDCILLPYFPPTEPEKFVAVHRVFGASNVCKMLQEIPIDEREDAVSSMVYEAKARLIDPVYGCVAIIASLQCQVLQLHSELSGALAEAMVLRNQLCQNYHHRQLMTEGSNHTRSDNSNVMPIFPQFIDSVQATGLPLLSESEPEPEPEPWNSD